ncbi:HET domain containing protein [Hyaloscypha variabilis]
MDSSSQSGALQVVMSPKEETSPSHTLATNADLCDACQKIDFDAVMTAVHKSFDEKIWWSLGPQPFRALEESATFCKLCHIGSFEDLTGDSASEDATRGPMMVSLSTVDSYDMSLFDLGFQAGVLRVEDYCRPYFNLEGRYEEPSAASIRRPYFRGSVQFCRRPGTDSAAVRFRVPTPKAPFDLIRSWLDFCKCHHGRDCAMGVGTTLSSLSMIDCEATPRRVVPFLPELGSYVALSYVWGTSSQDTNTHRLLEPGELPSILPRSIEDAIAVTLVLGFRYLWVDQYCIPQDNEEERAHQIRLMDEIYHAAELTIIAAAGKDANHGLPGVNSTPRKLLRSIQIGVGTLVDTPVHTFSLSHQATTWLRRGWTYQEGVLSRRRLFFLDTQVYFQCAEMSVWEAMDVSLDILHDEAAIGSQLRPARKFTKEPRFESLTQGTHNVDANIASYFSTELSRSEDAIQAISGIFSHFNKVGNQKMLVLSGLPLYIRLAIQIDPTGLALAPALLRALAWYLHFSPLLKRREIFPSWTWAGWEQVDGAAKSGYQRPNSTEIRAEHASPAVKVGILSKEANSQLLWRGVYELPWHRSGGQLIAQFIALTGWTFRVTVCDEESHTTGGSQSSAVDEFTIVLPDDTLVETFDSKLHRGVSGLMHGTELVAIPLYWNRRAKLHTNQVEMPVLLLYPTSKEIESNIVYERVGLANCWFGEDFRVASLMSRDDDPWRLLTGTSGVFQTVYIG